MENINKIFVSICQQEKNNLQLWLPVIFAISIAVALKWQMRIKYLILVNILISALLYYFKKHKNKIFFKPRKTQKNQ